MERRTHRRSIGIGRAGSWHTAFGRLLSTNTLLFYILASTHRAKGHKTQLHASAAAAAVAE